MTFKRKNPAELQAQLQQMKGGSGFGSNDSKEWKLKQDNAGNGQAVIRFLPGKGEAGLPFVKLVNHGFKKNGKWYIENCTSTHGDYESCPVCQHLSKNDSFNTNNEEYKLLKRKTSYWANILVVKDPAAPENEGKVFKFRFGQKVMDKINAMVEVDVEMGETPVDVTCPFEGANFVLKTKKVGGFTNYDESKFLGTSEIPKIEDEKYQAFLEEEMSDLSVLVAKDQFKSFEKNKEQFEKVYGTSVMGSAASKAASQADKLDDDLSAFEQDLDNYNASTKDSLDIDALSTPSTSTGADELDDLLDDL